MSIEKIEQALRANLDAVTPFTDADVMRYDHGGGRIAILRDGERKLVADTYHEADTEHFALCRPENIRAILDELSRLREMERRLRNALEPFADIAEIDDEAGRNDPDDDRIWILQAHGCLLAELTVEDFKAVARALSEREGQEE